MRAKGGETMGEIGRLRLGLTVGALRAKLVGLSDTMRVAVEITDESEDLVQAELRLADVEARCIDGDDEDAEWLYLWGDASGHADD